MREHYINPSDKTLLTILNDNVCEGTITGVIFQNFDGHFLVDGYRFKHNGELYTLPYDQEFFKDEDALKRNVNIEPQNNDKKFYLISGCNRANETQYYLKAGKAEPWQLNQSVDRYILGKDFKIENIDGFVPEKLYNTEEEFYYHNDLIIHKDNGDVEIKPAPINVLVLNDKQREIFERLKSVLKEMKDSNMVLMHDCSYNELSVINQPQNSDWYEWGSGDVPYRTNIPDGQTIEEHDIFATNDDMYLTL